MVEACLVSGSVVEGLDVVEQSGRPRALDGHALRTLGRVLRVLDLDLDFFAHGVAHFRGPDEGRLEESEHPPWSLDETISFLEDRCALQGKLPGFVVEHHGQLFAKWRAAIESGDLEAPFAVTHVDAHADMGLGDAGYKYLMTELLFEEAEEQRFPQEGFSGLGDGNFLAFAIACRWISELVYVFNDGGGDDLLRYHMENFDPLAGNIELKAVLPQEFDKAFFDRDPEVAKAEPLVPFRSMNWTAFRTEEQFDVICVAQSPPFTPPGSDVAFAEIRNRFIDESVFPPS